MKSFGGIGERVGVTTASIGARAARRVAGEHEDGDVPARIVELLPIRVY